MSRLALVHGDEADDVVSLAPLPSCRKIDELCYQGTQQDIANVLKTDPLVRGHNRIATPQTHHLASDVGKRRWLGQLFLHCHAVAQDIARAEAKPKAEARAPLHARTMRTHGPLVCD
jgi:hypothetical protein